MALTEERVRTTGTPAEARPEGESSVRGHSVVAPRRQGSAGTTELRWRVVLGLAWVVLLPLAIVLEPAAASEGAVPWWAEVLSLGFLAALIYTAVGIGGRRTWGAGASLVASSIFVAGVFACPASGHHAFGLWWVGELAAAVTVLSLSAVAYGRAGR